MFVISKNSLYREFWPRHRISFVISRTSLNRGSLNRSFTVLVVRMDWRWRGGEGGGVELCYGISYQGGSCRREGRGEG